jgi:hypothetical protein
MRGLKPPPPSALSFSAACSEAETVARSLREFECLSDFDLLAFSFVCNREADALRFVVDMG